MERSIPVELAVLYNFIGLEAIDGNIVSKLENVINFRSCDVHENSVEHCAKYGQVPYTG